MTAEPRQPDSHERVVAHNALISMLCGVANMVVRLVLPAYTLHHIGLEEYGIWAFAFAVISPIGMTTFGISNVYVRWVARFSAADDRDAINKLCSTGVAITALICCLVYGVLWFVTPALVSSLTLEAGLRHTAEHMIRGTTAVFLLSVVFGTFSSILDGLQKQSAKAVVLIAASVTEIACAIAFLLVGAGIYSLLIAYLIRTLFESVAMYALSCRHLPSFSLHPRHFDRGTIPIFLRYGGVVQVTGLLSVCLASAEKIVAGWFVGAWAMALYELGQKFLFSALSLASPITSALLPAMSRLYGTEHNAMQSLYFRGTRSVSLAAGTILGFFAAFAGPIMLAWIGERYGVIQAISIMTWFAVPYYFHVVTGPGSAAHRASGHPRRELYYHVSQAALVAVAVPISFFILGRNITGINAAIVPAMLCSQLIYFVYNNRVLGISNFAFFRRAIAPGLLPFLFAFALRWIAWPAVISTNRFLLVRDVALSGIAYLVITSGMLYLFVLSDAERSYARGILNSRFRGGPEKSVIDLVAPAHKPT